VAQHSTRLSKLVDVLPSPSVDNRPNRRLSDLIINGQLVLCYTISMTMAQVSNLLNRHLGMWIALATSIRGVATLYPSVTLIIGMTSHKQVIGTNTLGLITRMQHIHAAWNITVHNCISNAMCIFMFTFPPQRSIPLSPCTGPHPTFGGLIHFRPESVNCHAWPWHFWNLSLRTCAVRYSNI